VLQLAPADDARIRAIGPEPRAALGHIDAWVNNAGADIVTPAGDALPASKKLDLLLTVDLRGTILASWEAASILSEQAEGGVIINMSWDHVLTGMEGRNPQMYSAVKGGILSFSKSLARSVAPKVRVNILAPGWIETAFGANLEDARHRAVADSTPLKRWGVPDDVAGAAVFLASPAASFMTGQMLMVGGGIVM
jgi:3-oxoacyl-[acyl-carrier protein] reductase